MNDQEVTAENSVMDRVVATHMMIRVALSGLALAIVLSVLVQRARDDCWLTSISAYWYTDARTIFTGGLIAISICLIAYSGGTWTENLLLNLAGVLAPIVAIAPTRLGKDLDEACLGDRAPGTYDADATINGLTVYFIVLVVGALFTIAASRAVRHDLLARRKRTGEPAGKPALTKAQLRASWFGRATAVGIAAGLVLWWVVDDKFAEHAHFPSAVAMFVFLAFVAASRTERGSRLTLKWDLYRDTPTLPSALAQRRSFPYGFLYGCVAVAMLATLALAGINILLENGWDYGVIAAEFALLGLFLLFWLAQTIQMRDLTEFGGIEGSTAGEPSTEVLA